MNVLSLFSGIGGLDLGMERAGLDVVGQVEIDPYARTVLAHHWPEVPRHDDVRTAVPWWTDRPRPVVDVVAGGFPCQPFSTAGRHLGTGDPRWGWPWMADVVRAVGPRWVLVENVPALLADTRAFGTVLSDLADLGFDARWGLLSACAVGAPHTRQRLFLVAHSHRLDGAPRLGPGPRGPLPARNRNTSTWTDPIHGLVEADARGRRMAHGIPRRLDRPHDTHRIHALGNAVVPAVAQLITTHITTGPLTHTTREAA